MTIRMAPAIIVGAAINNTALLLSGRSFPTSKIVGPRGCCALACLTCWFRSAYSADIWVCDNLRAWCMRAAHADGPLEGSLRSEDRQAKSPRYSLTAPDMYS